MKKYSAQALAKQVRREAYEALEVLDGMLKSGECKDADKLKAADILLKLALRDESGEAGEKEAQVIRLVLGGQAQQASV